MTVIASFRPLRSALPVLAMAVSIATAGSGPTTAAAAVPPRAGRPAAISEPERLAVQGYWTPARMADAIPVGPLPGLPVRVALAALSAPLAGAVALAAPAEPQFMRASAQTAASQEHARRSGRARPGQPGQPAQGSGTAWRGGGAVARTTGRVFFTLDGMDYSCSGSTVASANADVALTAAHCVNNGAGSWAANWTFVPGYHDGKAPYGVYPARNFYMDSQWENSQDVDYDFAFVALNTAKVHGISTHAVTAAGGQRIRFGPVPAREYVFGYPAEPPFTGEQIDYCSGPTTPDSSGGDNDAGVDCGMTQGDSGGPWLSGFNPATGAGTITSVSSFKYNADSRILYGTQLGSAAESLYNEAQHR